MSSRASRRKAVIIPDDDDEENEGNVQLENVSHESTKVQSRKAGKSKAMKNSKSAATRPSTSNPSPQISKAKTEGSVKTPPKSSGRPIYSFFNSATQRQQVSQSFKSPDKASIPHEDIEIIQDDSGNATQDEISANTALSKGSTTALAMRKRKFQRTQSFEDEVAPPPTTSQKFRKASSGDRLRSLSVRNDDKRPWTEQFAPVDLSELVVHKRKVADVRTWLQMTFRGQRQKVLVLKGAAGTGKTVTARLLAKDLGVELIDWRDSAITDFASDEFVSAASRFEDFVRRAGKSTCLALSNYSGDTPSTIEDVEMDDSKEVDRPRALLIEEFPNTFSKTSSTLQSFRSTIAQYVSATVPVGSFPTPIIMIVSETLLATNTAAADSFTAHRLLGPELIANPYVNVIEFNPVAPTFLTKALETIVIKESRKSGRRKTPGPQVLKHLAETGDIRSAVSSLEFLCLRGDEDDTWSSKVTFTKTKQSKSLPTLTRSEEESLKLIMNRESSFGIFHSVGKVVYNKRKDSANASAIAQPPSWLPQHARTKIPETDADSLINELGTDTSTFLAALHENYALSCSCSSSEGSLESLLGCMDSLSNSDLLSLDRFSFGTRAFSGSATDTLRQDELCFQVAVRGMLFNLPNPVHRGTAISGNRGDAHRMFYPASLKLWKKREEVESKLELLIKKFSNASGTKSLTRTTDSLDSHAGVAGWKRNDEVDAQPQSSTEVRNEMLMDRLPYLSRIMSAVKESKYSQSELDQVLAVTRISGAAPILDDDADADEHEESANAAEQWTTDRPDTETGTAPGTPRKRILSNKQKSVFEAMSIPVEARVENLILDDDDIEDD